MGIKGIYPELGPGERVPLIKLAVEHRQRHNRPYRIAVDVSIWAYQVQLGEGGENPALRTLFYRLVHLLSLSIQPLFVFDGSGRPLFKRNQVVSASEDSLLLFQAKQYIKAFGFPIVEAPGEAEAECARLQQHGIVDAVLTEDADVLMFGSSVSMRNFSKQINPKSKAATLNNTHVTVHRLEDIKAEKGLTPEGMILFALMSGGDYLPAGIPGCGPKIAMEAAQAGFGKDLCRIGSNNAIELRGWRSRLENELHTNESKFFRTKHKALSVPEDFPNEVVLGYYTHPTVSSSADLEELKQKLDWNRDVDLVKLRNLVAKDFNWKYRGGARLLIKQLAPALLVQKLSRGMLGPGIGLYVHSKRQHDETPGMPEVRIEYTPREIMDIDLEAEAEELVDLAAAEELATQADPMDIDGELDGVAPVAKRQFKPFYPGEPQRTWIPEHIFRLGASKVLDKWEQRNAGKKAPKKTTKSASSGMQFGALHPFLVTQKPKTDPPKPEKPEPRKQLFQSAEPKVPGPQLLRASQATSSQLPSSSAGSSSSKLWDSAIQILSDDDNDSFSDLPSPKRLLQRLKSKDPREVMVISSSPYSSP